MVAVPSEVSDAEMNFDTGKFLDSCNMFGIRLGLDAAKELLERAGRPDKNLRFIHIAGTNGKGSVSAMLERSLRECGCRTGLYTSPHLIDVRERFRIDGKAVSTENFNRLGAELAAEAEGHSFSYFEFATVLAMKIFADAGVDIVIWETGMGGRLDATNIIEPEAAVITSIALDHQAHLGSTLGAIAAEKAGILKKNVPLFTGRLPEEAREVIHAKAVESGCPEFAVRENVPECGETFIRDGKILQKFNYDGREIELSLPGKMQRENFRIAYEIILFLAGKYGFSVEKALGALSDVRWPARFQWVNERVLVDGGHNPDGVAALTEAVKESCPGEKFMIIYSAFADKDAENCIPLLSEIAGEFVFTSVGSDGRAAFDEKKLASLAGSYDVPSTVIPDISEALQYALENDAMRIIVSGSLYLAGAVLEKIVDKKAVLDL